MKKIRLITIFIFVAFAVALMGCMGSSDSATGGASGVVVDSSGKALSGAKITAGGNTAVSDYYGKWSFESLEPQILEFICTKENYQTQKKTYEVQSGIILENITFVMPSDGEIYDVVVSNVTSTKASISFHTKFEASGKIAYGSNGSLDKVVNSTTNHKYTHTFELTGLIPGTTYIFQALGTDRYNRSLSSEVKTFTTAVAARSEPPTGLKIAKVTGNGAFSLTWNGDAASDFAGFNIYRSTSLNGVFERVNTALVLSSAYVDMGVTVGEKYCYRVTRVSGSGDESSPSAVVSMVMPGTINGNVVWNSQGSPYELSGDLTVAQGASLIISKGSEVRVSSLDKWDADSTTDKVGIKVYGTLMIQGTKSEPVSITSAENVPQLGDWEGIIFGESADLVTSSIKGLNIQFATIGIKGKEGLPLISESSFRNCSESAIYTLKASKDISITNCEMLSCFTGINIGNSTAKVKISDSLFKSCSYAIKAINNSINEISNNKIKENIITAIEVGGIDRASSVYRNTIGWGTGGLGILCKGFDEVRRNTVQADLCIQVKDTATAYIRSNLLLTDKNRNATGLVFVSSLTSSPKLFIQSNGVWNQTTAAMKYANSNGLALAVSGDLAFAGTSGPALQGGDPFTGALTDSNFSYTPNAGSALKNAGYDSNEDVGAEDVPN